MEKTYRLKKSWRTGFIVLGILACALILLAPFGILMFVLAAKAAITVRERDVVVKWIGTRTIPWDQFEELRQGTFSVHGLGVAGAVAGAALVKGPLTYKLKGKRMRGNIAVHWHEDAVEILREFQARTGLTIQA